MEPEELEVQEDSTTIDNLEDALSELKKVRREAASKRTQNRDLKEKADLYDKFLDSQKSDVERLTQVNANTKGEADASREKADRLDVILRFGLAFDPKNPNEYDEVLTGSRSAMEKIAKLLTDKTGTRTVTDFHAGRRGSAVGTGAEQTVQEVWSEWWNNQGKD